MNGAFFQTGIVATILKGRPREPDSNDYFIIKPSVSNQKILVDCIFNSSIFFT